MAKLLKLKVPHNIKKNFFLLEGFKVVAKLLLDDGQPKLKLVFAPMGCRKLGGRGGGVGERGFTVK